MAQVTNITVRKPQVTDVRENDNDLPVFGIGVAIVDVNFRVA